MRMSLLTYVFALVGAVAVSSCSPKSDTANLRVAMPDWNAARAKSLAHQSKVSTLSVPTFAEVSMVVINVTGPNMQPIFRSFERQEGQSSIQIPSEISLVVPKGSERLVQVLALFEGSGSTEFYYGDQKKNFSRDVEPLGITVQNILSTSNVRDGQIDGRFMDAGGGGPTGTFRFRFNPGAGKPSMIVHEGETFGGWVHLFSLSLPGILSYEMNGSPIFSGVYSQSSELHNGSYPQRSLRLSVPAGYARWNRNGTIVPEGKNAKDVVVGFFGPGAPATAKACYVSTTGGSLESYFLDEAGASPVLWNGGAGADSQKAYVDLTAGGIGSGVVGYPGCADGGTEWADYITLYHTRLSDESAVAFRGPFAATQITNYGAEFVTLTHDGTSTMNVSWKYLPGANTSLPGVGVFYRILPPGSGSSDDDIRAKEGYRCDELTDSSKFGIAFSEMRVLDNNAVTASVSGISPAQFSSAQVVVCPLKSSSGPYYHGGVAKTQSSGGGGMNPATQLAAYDLMNATHSSVGSPAAVYSSSCYPVKVRALDASGNRGNVSGNSSQNIVVSTTSSILWPYSGCSASGSSTITLSGGFYGETTFWMKDASTSALNDLAISYNGGGLSSTNFFVQMNDGTANPATELKMVLPVNIKPFECVPVEMVSLRTGIPASVSTSTTATVGEADWLFYYGYDAMCSSSTITTADFASSGGQVNVSLNARYIGATTGALSKSFTNDQALTNTAGQTSVQATGPAAKLAVFMTSVMNADGCYSVNSELQDATGQPTGVVDALVTDAFMSVQLTATNATFFNDPNCNSGASATQTINEFNTRAVSPLYIKTAFSGPVTVTAHAQNLEGGITIADGSATVATLGSAVASRIVALWPGETISGCVKSGTPSTIRQGEPINISFVATTTSGCVADGTGGTTAFAGVATTVGSSACGGCVSVASAPLSFTGAYATRTATINPLNFAIATDLGLYVSASGYSFTSLVPQTPLWDFFPTSFLISGPTSVTTGVCQPLLFSFVDASGYPRRVNEVHTFSLSTNASSYYIGYSSTCSTPTGPVSLDTSSGQGLQSYIQPLYFKIFTAGGFSTFTVSDTTGTNVMTTLNRTMDAAGSGSGNATKLTVLIPANAKVGQCVPVQVQTTDASGQALPPASYPVNATLTDNGGGTFYQDLYCSTVNNVFAISSGTSGLTSYYVPASAGSITIDASGGGLTNGTATITVDP